MAAGCGVECIAMARSAGPTPSLMLPASQQHSTGCREGLQVQKKVNPCFWKAAQPCSSNTPDQTITRRQASRGNAGASIPNGAPVPSVAAVQPSHQSSLLTRGHPHHKRHLNSCSNKISRHYQVQAGVNTTNTV